MKPPSPPDAAPDAGEPFEQALQRAKHASTLQLWLRCARLLHEEALDRVRAASGHEGLRTSQLSIFPHLDLEGTRLGELARRMGISKQAVGELVDELEGFGVVERVPDPRDKRGRVVRLTEHGRRAMLHGLSILIELERELEAEVGPEAWAQLRATTLRVLARVERAEPRGG